MPCSCEMWNDVGQQWLLSFSCARSWHDRSPCKAALLLAFPALLKLRHVLQCMCICG